MRICFWLVAALAGPGPEVSARPPTVTELLLKYEFTVRRLARFHIQAEVDQSSSKEVSSTARIAIYRDGARWKVTRTNRTRRKFDGKFHSFDSGTEYLLDNEGLHVQWSIPQNGDEGAVAYLDPADAERRLWPYMQRGEILFGHTSGDDRQPLWRVMRDAEKLELLPAMETVDGFETYVVKSSGKFGSHSVWLDPNAGFLPRRIEVLKRTGDFLNHRKLGVGILKEGAGDSMEFAPVKPEIKEIRDRFEKVQIEVQQGRPMITAFEWTRRIVDENDKATDYRADYRIRTVAFGDERWPADAFDPTLTFPDGRELPAKPAPNAPFDRDNYEWWNGWVREKIRD